MTISGSGVSWSATIDAVVGVSPVTETSTSAALAVDAARDAAQAAVLAFADEQGTTVGAVELAALESRLRAACSQALFALEHPAPTYPTPSTYGEDVTTFPDLSPTFALVSGQRAIAEAVARRLLTGLGQLPWAPDVGYDVRALLNAGLTTQRLAQLQLQVQAEAEGDERVLSASATATYNASAQTLTIKVQLVSADGPFRLVLTISQLAVDLTVL